MESSLTAAERAQRIEEIIAEHSSREGPLLPILHDVQRMLGFVDDGAKRQIAASLNLSRAEVQGVVSFYHDFHDHPEPRPVIKLCRAEACQARGVEALVEDAYRAAGKRVAIETVYCLGLCSVGPAAMVGREVHARLDGERLAALIGEAA